MNDAEHTPSPAQPPTCPSCGAAPETLFTDWIDMGSDHPKHPSHWNYYCPRCHWEDVETEEQKRHRLAHPDEPGTGNWRSRAPEGGWLR